jgi:TonB family protein
VDGGVHSFSWGHHIVMSRDDLESSPAILTHERMHVTKKHSLDIAFFSAVTVLHWFNPLVWITLSELKLLHEYEADEAVIQNGIDATQYQLLMVKKAVGEQRFSLANGFQHSKLKNRINMMIKPHTSGWMRLSYVAVLPVLAALMFACNPAREQEEPAPAPEQLETKAVQGIDAPKELIDILGTLESMDADKADLEVLRDLLRQYGELKGKDDADKDALRDIWFAFMKKSNEIAKSLKSDDYDVKAAVERGESVPFQLLEDKPTFNGGDANEFSKWVNANLKYPEAAKASGAQGRVTLQFTVGKDGTVGNVKILRGASEELDAEALRVISNSPKWEPGRIDGKPVPVTFTFPVVFKLK